jgi:hypothetical protein
VTRGLLRELEPRKHGPHGLEEVEVSKVAALRSATWSAIAPHRSAAALWRRKRTPVQWKP